MTERDNKVAVISGASRGIGAALMTAYRVRGYSVVATSRSIRPATDPEILTVAGDIAEPETGQRVIDAAWSASGASTRPPSPPAARVAPAWDLTQGLFRRLFREVDEPPRRHWRAAAEPD
jgi:NAD(P)-dependent dehydrogenase (short-subunit alcohol dehydrogenase family)